MNFSQLFKKSNSSLNQLQGNVLHCSVSEVRGDLVVVETGLARSSVCFQSELTTNIAKAAVSPKNSCMIGIDQVESAIADATFGSHLVYPKLLQKISRRKIVWTELTKIWRSSQNNRIKGFILNSVKGGYAVAIAGYIAFLPRSLRFQKKVFHSQWRKFSILNINPKRRNIVVKEYSSKKNVPPYSSLQDIRKGFAQRSARNSSQAAAKQAAQRGNFRNKNNHGCPSVRPL
jgi:ribosomal protein S1